MADVPQSYLHRWGVNFDDHTMAVQDDGEGIYYVSSFDMIVRALSAILTRPDVTANQYVQVASGVLTQQRLRAALEKRTGVKWSAGQRTRFDEEHRNGLEQLEQGDYSGAMRLIVAAVYGGYCAFTKDPERVQGNKLLGLGEPSVERALDEAGV